jgi:hypothetical protein
MTAEPVGHQPDPLDPAQILADLPEDERPSFLAAYRERVDAARDPEGWEALRKYLRRMRFHADNTKDPEYRRDLDAARNGTGGGMRLEDYIAMRHRA